MYALNVRKVMRVKDELNTSLKCLSQIHSTHLRGRVQATYRNSLIQINKKSSQITFYVWKVLHIIVKVCLNKSFIQICQQVTSQLWVFNEIVVRNWFAAKASNKTS